MPLTYRENLSDYKWATPIDKRSDAASYPTSVRWENLQQTPQEYHTAHVSSGKEFHGGVHIINLQTIQAGIIGGKATWVHMRMMKHDDSLLTKK